jgi:hypothetical protein
VGFLDSFERQVERIVGGAFAKTFTSGVHPIEIVAALKREVDASARVISRTRIVAPHSFHIGLAEIDLTRLQSLGPAFIEEITQAVIEYSMTRGYSFSDTPTLALEHSPSLVEGLVDIRSDSVGKVVWVPTLTWADTRYPIIRKSTVIGRGSDADVPVTARGVSRHHAEIRWDGKRAEVVDLGSTNGVKLDGETVTRAALPDACHLTLGQARILFQVVPLAESAYHSLAHKAPAHAEETP